MKYLLMVLFSFTLSAQTLLTESFNDFMPDTTHSDIVAMWIMDETNYPGTARTDHGTNGVDLLVGAATGGQVQSSVLLNGGYSESFNNSGSWYVFGGATVNMTGDMSIAVVYNKDDAAGTEYLFSHDDGSGNRQHATLFNGTSHRFQVFGATNAYRPVTIAASTWYVAVGVYNATTPSLDLYLNGTASASAVVGTIPTSLNSISATATTVSGIANGTLDFSGDVTLVTLYGDDLTAKEAKEIALLAKGWRSNSGGVSRASWAFHQGVTADTVYYSTALTAGNWSVQVNVDGAAGGESLKVLTSADATTWSTLGTISATTTATGYTVTGTGLGYIGFGLASGTVYLDDITVTLQANQQSGFGGFAEHGKWLGW